MIIQVGDTIRYKERDSQTTYSAEVIEADTDPKEELPYHVRNHLGNTLWLFADEVVSAVPNHATQLDRIEAKLDELRAHFGLTTDVS